MLWSMVLNTCMHLVPHVEMVCERKYWLFHWVAYSISSAGNNRASTGRTSYSFGLPHFSKMVATKGSDFTEASLHYENPLQ